MPKARARSHPRASSKSRRQCGSAADRPARPAPTPPQRNATQVSHSPTPRGGRQRSRSARPARHRPAGDDDARGQAAAAPRARPARSAAATTMASPPPRGVATAWEPRWLGTSRRPLFNAIRRTTPVITAAATEGRQAHEQHDDRAVSHASDTTGRCAPAPRRARHAATSAEVRHGPGDIHSQRPTAGGLPRPSRQAQRARPAGGRHRQQPCASVHGAGDLDE